MTKERDIDWERIEAQYGAGSMSLREIATEHGLSEGAIRKRAKRDVWDPRQAGVRSKVVLSAAPAGAKTSEGFLYVLYIDAGGERLFKIGISTSFGSRIKTLQTAMPFELCVACCYFAPHAVAEERALHQHFDEQRVRGEWFHLSPEDVQWIAARSVLL